MKISIKEVCNKCGSAEVAISQFCKINGFISSEIINGINKFYNTINISIAVSNDLINNN